VPISITSPKVFGRKSHIKGNSINKTTYFLIDNKNSTSVTLCVFNAFLLFYFIPKGKEAVKDCGNYVSEKFLYVAKFWQDAQLGICYRVHCMLHYGAVSRRKKIDWLLMPLEVIELTLSKRAKENMVSLVSCPRDRVINKHIGHSLYYEKQGGTFFSCVPPRSNFL